MSDVMIYEVRCLNLSISNSWFRHVHTALHTAHTHTSFTHCRHTIAFSLFPINEFNLLERTPISISQKGLWFSGDWLVNNEIEFPRHKRKMKTYPTPCQMWLECNHSDAYPSHQVIQCPNQFVSFSLKLDGLILLVVLLSALRTKAE